MKYQLLKFEGDHINHSVNLFLLHPPPPSPFFLSRASLKRLESLFRELHEMLIIYRIIISYTPYIHNQKEMSNYVTGPKYS